MDEKKQHLMLVMLVLVLLGIFIALLNITNLTDYYSMEDWNIQKGENEYIVELKIDRPLKYDVEKVLINKNDYDAYVHEDLNKLTYKDKDGAISQISVNKVKSIKILEEWSKGTAVIYNVQLFLCCYAYLTLYYKKF